MFFQEAIIARDYNNYPIGTRLFQYFILKTYGTYSESVVLTYFYIIYFSFVIYPLTKIEELKQANISKYLIVLLYAIIALLYPTCFFETISSQFFHIFRFLLVDLLLGMTFGFTIFVISTQKKFDSHSTLLLFLLLFFLVQIKVVGIIFAVATLLLIVLRDKNLKRGLYFVIPIILAKASWYFYLKHHRYGNIFYNSHKKILVANDFIKIYWQALIKKEVFLYLSPIGLILVTSCIALYFIIFYKSLRTYIIKLYLVLFILFIVFNFGLYTIYMKVFTSTETLILSSFERYQEQFWGGIIFILFLYLPKLFMQFKKHIVLLLMLNVIFGIFTYKVYKNDIKTPDSVKNARLNIIKIKDQLPKDFASKNIVMFSEWNKDYG